MALALQRLRVFVLAQDILIELHVGPKEILEPCLNSLSISEHFLGDIIGVDVDTDRANDSKLFSFNWDRRAFEFSRADVQLVIQFVLVKELTLLKIDQKIRRPVAQVSAGRIVFQHDQRMRWVSEIMEQDLDSGIRKGLSN